MPFVPSVRPFVSRPVSTIKKRAETLASSKTKPSRNVTRFGNGDKEPGKLKLMFQNAFNPKSLMWDGVWGIGMSIVATLIPPHAPMPC